MVTKKLIRLSIRPHAAPTFCVRKPIGWRIVHDYRYFNSTAVRQQIPMTRKEGILDVMVGSYWLSAMHFMSAYYQVRMREEDIKLLPSRLRMVSKIFPDLKNTRSFYDDIYMITKSPRIEGHLAARDMRYSSSVPKRFHASETFLDKTSSVFALLNKKNNRNAKFHFNDKLVMNVKELKRRLCNPPVFHLPVFNQPMQLRTDTSKFTVGRVMFKVVNGVESYRLRQSQDVTRGAQLLNTQEHLAIINALVAFRIYCLDKPPVVETDHKPFEGLFTQKMANHRLARWYDILAEYQPTLSYLPGAKNGIADALSR
ncbi:LOW QUALITY PROTEIN: Uncharacterized protein PHPALM_19737 [Phytophthora palmivora]|uniref:Reverse transcriptase RNase H-like domain-containing protein n=1 Tax=Phytophthora palmivora TaxID=4796 RepID=A0A2P4XGM2_9STRA|nr:LOW QUALITY PROTEIN: Uncharacterized protein PHPALM_19737 [Phytophthora palmivora]